MRNICSILSAPPLKSSITLPILHPTVLRLRQFITTYMRNVCMLTSWYAWTLCVKRFLVYRHRQHDSFMVDVQLHLVPVVKLYSVHTAGCCQTYGNSAWYIWGGFFFSVMHGFTLIHVWTYVKPHTLPTTTNQTYTYYHCINTQTYLRNVLDQSDYQLDVREDVEEVEPG